jgi:4-hydroxybenzoate polyprenyltransferase
LLGNIIVALLTAMVPFLVLLFELPLLARAYGSDVTPGIHYLLIWVLGFSLFAFLLNLTREIVKDAEDFEGDQAFGKRTMPVVWGMKITRWITALMILITATLLLLAWKYFIHDRITLLYFIAILIIPLFIVLGLMLRGRSRKAFHTSSTFLKLIMTAGLLYMIVVNVIINSM